jgi:hypothetical protein
MMRRMLTVVTLLAPPVAKAQVPVLAPGQAGGDCLDHREELPLLEGRSEGAARAMIGRMGGIRHIRVLGPVESLTMDYRPDRVTLLIRDGRVERADCG